MIKFKFEDQTVSLPEKWSEVTVEIFSNPDFYSGNAIYLLSSFSGVPVEKLMNTTKDLTKYLVQISNLIIKDKEGYRGKPDVPITFKLLDVNCKVPTNIELRSFGQKVMYGQALAKCKYSNEAIPEAIAIYLAPQIFPKDWYERIDEITDAVRQMKIVDCYSLADFFLLSILRHRSDGIKS